MVMLRNWETKAVLGSMEVAVAASIHWRMYNFSMTTAANGTICTGIAPGSDPEVDCHTMRKGMAVPPSTEQGHICIRCGGEFVIALSEPGTVHVDYVFLQPGAWGRYGPGPVPQGRSRRVDGDGYQQHPSGRIVHGPELLLLEEMAGHTMGARESRCKVGLGAHLRIREMSSFGPFDFIDMCDEVRTGSLTNDDK